ncbi:hypothetical protein DIPPA_03664 [Diplonema papillatum]|nr:hypothetical protein DIPPA_03664 [Diplonema papillatum]
MNLLRLILKEVLTQRQLIDARSPVAGLVECVEEVVGNIGHGLKTVAIQCVADEADAVAPEATLTQTESWLVRCEDVGRLPSEHELDEFFTKLRQLFHRLPPLRTTASFVFHLTCEDGAQFSQNFSKPRFQIESPNNALMQLQCGPTFSIMAVAGRIKL